MHIIIFYFSYWTKLLDLFRNSNPSAIPLLPSHIHEGEPCLSAAAAWWVTKTQAADSPLEMKPLPCDPLMHYASH